MSARAPATVGMYDRAFRRWKEFALSPGELPRLPTAAWASEFFRGTGGGGSVSAKDGYVKDNITSRISVSKSLGL